MDKVEETGKKWHGGVKEPIKAPADKAWAIAANFCELNKWFKTCERCDTVEGEFNKPGCVRYVVGNTFPRADGAKSWANEKLLSIDEANYDLTYSMLDNNFGLDGYVGHFKLQDLGDGTSLVDWSFEVNPAENRTEEQLATYMTAAFKKALKLLEDLCSSDSK